MDEQAAYPATTGFTSSGEPTWNGKTFAEWKSSFGTVGIEDAQLRYFLSEYSNVADMPRIVPALREKGMKILPLIILTKIYLNAGLLEARDLVENHYGPLA